MTCSGAHDVDQEPGQKTHRGVRRVWCVNKACSELDIRKLVRLPRVGDGLFLGGPILCGTCDLSVWVER